MKNILGKITGAAVIAASIGGASAITVIAEDDPAALIGSILGTGITVTSSSFTGTSSSAGTFSDGLSAGMGIDGGIVLTSGDVSHIDGFNDDDGAGTANGLPGDSDLDILSGDSTFDATILEFDFVFGDGSTGGDLFFEYVFASEEYNEFVGGGVNDSFGFFLDGSNVALLPDDTVVSIDTINGGVNDDLFNNNDLDDGGPFFAFEYDGFTDALAVSATGLSAGSHTIALKIGDGGDSILDSAVFIKGKSFSTQPPSSVPDGGASLLLALIPLLGLDRLRRRRRSCR